MDASALELKQMVTLIHVAKRELRIPDDSYRDLLRAETGLESTKGMQYWQMEKVLKRLRKDGFKVRHKTNKGLSRPIQTKTTDGDRYASKIRSLWFELHDTGIVRSKSENAINAYVKRIVGVEALQWLDNEQASTVIETLKKWRNRISDHAKP